MSFDLERLDEHPVRDRGRTARRSVGGVRHPSEPRDHAVPATRIDPRVRVVPGGVRRDGGRRRPRFVDGARIAGFAGRGTLASPTPSSTALVQSGGRDDLVGLVDSPRSGAADLVRGEDSSTRSTSRSGLVGIGRSWSRTVCVISGTRSGSPSCTPSSAAPPKGRSGPLARRSRRLGPPSVSPGSSRTVHQFPLASPRDREENRVVPTRGACPARTKDLRWPRFTSYPAGTPSWGRHPDPSTSTPGTAAFYGALFGWEAPDLGPETGGYRLFLKGGKPVAGVGPQMMAAAPVAWTTYVNVDDIASSTAKAAAGGADGPLRPGWMSSIPERGPCSPTRSARRVRPLGALGPLRGVSCQRVGGLHLE